MLQDEGKINGRIRSSGWPRPSANAPPPPICPRVPLKRSSRMQGLPADTDGNMATEVKLARYRFDYPAELSNSSVNGN